MVGVCKCVQYHSQGSNTIESMARAYCAYEVEGEQSICTTKNILVRKCLQVDVHYVFVVLLDDSTGKCQNMIFGK